MPIDRSGGAGCTLYFNNVAFTAQLFDDEFCGAFADRFVFSPDSTSYFGVDFAVQRHDWNFCVHNLLYNGCERLGLQGADDEHLDSAGHQAFNVAYLFRGLVLAVGDDQIHIRVMFRGKLLIPLDHRNSPRMVHSGLGKADHDFVFRCQPRDTVQREECDAVENESRSCILDHSHHVCHLLFWGPGRITKLIKVCYLFLSFSISTNTAPMMIAPFKICWVNGVTPAKFRTLASTARIAAPSIVPEILPCPPNKLAPPITVIAMASSSRPVPAVGSATLNRATKTIAVTAASTPLTI